MLRILVINDGELLLDEARKSLSELERYELILEDNGDEILINESYGAL